MDKRNIQEIEYGIARIREYDKEIQSLYDHLYETAEKSKQFAQKVGLGTIGELLGWLHDIGKNTRQFTDYILSATGLLDDKDDRFIDHIRLRGQIDHSTLGAKLATEKIGNNSLVRVFLSQLLALCCASHHGGLIDCLTLDGIDKFVERIGKTIDSSAYENLDTRVKEKIEQLVQLPEIIDEASYAINFMQKNYKTEEVYFMAGMVAKYLLSCLIDGDRLSTIDFLYPRNKEARNDGVYPSWVVLAKRLENELKSYKADDEIGAIRKQISDKCLAFADQQPGIYQLTTPTGGGKTLSSLRFAINHAKRNKMKRIIYVIPYTSIIDQNARKIRGILETEKSEHLRVVLEHHSNIIADDEDERLIGLLAENWDSPIVITTMVQYLNTIFSRGTKSIRRLHNLANSVIIFDEIQTLPIKCVHMFNASLKFLVEYCKSTAVLCTASQPLLDNLPGEKGKDLSLRITAAQQIVDNYKELYEKMKRVQAIPRIKPEGWSTSEIGDLIRAEVNKTNSILVIVNTKKSANALYNELANDHIDILYYLSTNMCPAHRMDKLDEIKYRLDNGLPTICISTQLIEAGVDIDFSLVVRYLAGLDSIAQAAGRCNRNGRMAALGKVYVVNPADENINRLHDIKIGAEKARRVIDEYIDNPAFFNNDILGIEAIKQYYIYYFYEQANRMSYPIKNSPPLYELLAQNSTALEEYRRINNGKRPKWVLNQSFKTAAEGFEVIDSATRGVIVPYNQGKKLIEDLCSETDLQKVYKLIRQAQKYSVNLYEDTLNRLWDENAIYEVRKGTGIYYLAEENYDDNLGLIENQSKMSTMNF